MIHDVVFKFILSFYMTNLFYELDIFNV